MKYRNRLITSCKSDKIGSNDGKTADCGLRTIRSRVMNASSVRFHFESKKYGLIDHYSGWV